MTNHAELTYPDTTGESAWDQIGPCVADDLTEYYGVRGMDGGRYVLEGFGGAWRIVRAGHYGLGAVVHSHTPKGAVQRLNAFHEGETCIHCQHVHASRGHHCESCGDRRYA